MTMTQDNLLTEENEGAIAVPDKFRDAETGKISLDRLLQSYQELERKLSSNAASPNSLSAPATPDDYNITLPNPMMEMDAEVNQRLHAKGFTEEQVQEVYNLAAEKLMPVMSAMVQEYEADKEIERLLAEFGGEEKWAEMSRQMLAFGQKNLAPNVLENLATSYDGVMALYKMMKSEEPNMSVRDGTVKAEGTDDLNAMMRDPRYWREKDPVFVSKVTNGFKKIYGSK